MQVRHQGHRGGGGGQGVVDAGRAGRFQAGHGHNVPGGTVKIVHDRAVGHPDLPHLWGVHGEAHDRGGDVLLYQGVVKPGDG